MSDYGSEDQNQQRDDFDELLERVSDLWKGGDGLEYQIKIREEWDERSEQIADLLRYVGPKRPPKDLLDHQERDRDEGDDR